MTSEETLDDEDEEVTAADETVATAVVDVVQTTTDVTALSQQNIHQSSNTRICRAPVYKYIHKYIHTVSSVTFD